ncbi:PUA-like domain-containing protein [Mycena metata]|uniref:PUA-like domain-containing protein n=1 Tax=Mycena metata TaxID=1033252 RepID=A0AAD7JW27_9AGAR|nr:PUA-like domain-containing protein [Mycena metata]
MREPEPIVSSTFLKPTDTLNSDHEHDREQDSKQKRVKAKPDRPAGVYGNNGITVGATFASRRELWKAGVHGMSQAGIHGRSDAPAYSLVMSGRYADDLDEGETFVYSGEGGTSKTGPNGKPTFNGKQCADQESSRGNLSLQLSAMEIQGKRKPVRVIRGHTLKSRYAPETGYRYDGLYEVVDVIHEIGKSTFKTYQYKLKRLPNQPPLPNEVPRREPRFKKETAPKSISTSFSSSSSSQLLANHPKDALQPEPTPKQKLPPSISPSPSSSRLPPLPKKNMAAPKVLPAPSSSRLPSPLPDQRLKRIMAPPTSIPSSSSSAPGGSFSEWRVATVASLSNCWWLVVEASHQLVASSVDSVPNRFEPRLVWEVEASRGRGSTAAQVCPDSDTAIDVRLAFVVEASRWLVAIFVSSDRILITTDIHLDAATDARPAFSGRMAPPARDLPSSSTPVAGWSQYSSPVIASPSQRTFTSMPPPTRDPPFQSRAAASMPPRPSFSSTSQARMAPPAHNSPSSSRPIASSLHNGQGSSSRMGHTTSSGLAKGTRPPLSPLKRKLFSSIHSEIEQGDYKRRRDQ